jgi:hypothetical protein
MLCSNGKIRQPVVPFRIMRRRGVGRQVRRREERGRWKAKHFVQSVHRMWIRMRNPFFDVFKVYKIR